eukprot:2226290-Rhodomonas_salina.2
MTLPPFLNRAKSEPVLKSKSLGCLTSQAAVHVSNKAKLFENVLQKQTLAPEELASLEQASLVVAELRFKTSLAEETRDMDFNVTSPGILEDLDWMRALDTRNKVALQHVVQRLLRVRLTARGCHGLRHSEQSLFFFPIPMASRLQVAKQPDEVSHPACDVNCQLPVSKSESGHQRACCRVGSYRPLRLDGSVESAWCSSQCALAKLCLLPYTSAAPT